MINLENPNSPENLQKRLESATYDVNWRLRELDKAQIKLEFEETDCNASEVRRHVSKLAEEINLANVLAARLHALKNPTEEKIIPQVETEKTVLRLVS